MKIKIITYVLVGTLCIAACSANNSGKENQSEDNSFNTQNNKQTVVTTEDNTEEEHIDNIEEVVVEPIGGYSDEYTTDIPEDVQAIFDKAYENCEHEITLIAFVGRLQTGTMNYLFEAIVDGEEKSLYVYKDINGECGFFHLD